MVLHPTDPKVFALRYEAALGGLLFSRDGGKTVRIVPGQSFYKYPLRWQVPLLMGGDGKLQIALDDELHSDDGSGCNLTHSEAPIAGALISDLAAHPSDPQVSYVLTTPDIVSGTDAKPSHTGIWRRDAAGITPVGTSDSATPTLGAVPFRPTSLKVITRAASMNGLRFIEAGLTADSAQPMAHTAVVRISDDNGVSWTTRAIASGDASDAWPQILLVSGADPFRALVSLVRGLGEDEDDPFDSIYLTKDGAQSFAPYLENQVQVSGEALLLPGGQILVGERGSAGGLWSAPDFDSAPSRVQDFRVHCMAYEPASQTLYMCKRYELGSYDPRTNTFCTLFTMTDATGMVSCAEPLEQNAKAVHQLCNGYCSAQHFAEAPLCSTFDPGSLLCGPSADAWDREYGYLPPPGTLMSPRCSGFPEAMRDAGTPSVTDASSDAIDAGTDNEADTGIGEGDAGAGDDEAKADEGEDDEGEDDEGDERDDSDDDELEDAGTKRRKRRGCHCTLADARDDGEPLLLTLLFSLTFIARRQRRAR